MLASSSTIYRGRIAPTPTGYLHLGHAATFSKARERATVAQGILIYRDENLDPNRCKEVFSEAAINDLKNWGLTWDEGPDIGGPYLPYRQSERTAFYIETLKDLISAGFAYPCPYSRKEIDQRSSHSFDGESIFPHSLRPSINTIHPIEFDPSINWRFKVPDRETIEFADECKGNIAFQTDIHFGDFLVWRKDGIPSYELAVVVDDHLMKITEVVRGEDLLLSTARQILIYRAMKWTSPQWYHAPLIKNGKGDRLAKTVASISLNELLGKGYLPIHSFDAIQHLAQSFD